MRILITGLAVLAMAGSSLAATRKVPQQYESIQAAVDDADAGDTIKISAGRYDENVSFSKDGIRFLGKNVIWNGDLNGETGTCLSASGNGILIQGITFANGNPHLSIGGNDLTVQKCVFRNGWQNCLYVEGSNLRFVKNTVVGAYRGVQSYSDDALYEKNVFRGVYAKHVEAYGDRVVYRSNRNSGAYDDDAVYITGNDAQLLLNQARNIDDVALRVSGDGALFQKNNVNGNYAGIRVDGNDAVVDSNSARHEYYYPIQVYGDGALVTDNDAGDSYYGAMYVDGTDNVVVGNDLSGAVDDPGLYFYGQGGRAEGNVISDCGNYGIYTSAAGSRIAGNRISNIFMGYGIYVTSGGDDSGGMVIEGNTVTETANHGIYLDYHDCTLTGNTVTGAGTYYYAAFYISGDNNTLDGNQAVEANDTGFRIFGTGNSLTDCSSTGAVVNGFRIGGTDTTLDGCEASGSGGQGFLNEGTNTTVTDSTFLGNGLDVANTGTLNGGTTGMTFETGGENQSPLFYDYD
jgi:parallel beta-helix repeat protein